MTGITARQIAEASVKSKTAPNKVGDPWGDGSAWSSEPYFRGGSRPPRVNSSKSANANVDSSGKKRQLFNPKAKLDPTQVQDRRPGHDHNWTPQPYTGPGADDKSRLPPNKGVAPVPPTFKWNTKDHPLPAPKKTDMVNTRKSSQTAMQKAIEQAGRQRKYQEFRQQGARGFGQ